MKLVRRENNTMFDCHNYSYDFILDDLILSFHQAGSGDLMFACFSREYKNKINVKINKEENSALYILFSKLYDNIIDEMKSNPRYFQDENFKQLYDGKKISWKSDAPVNDSMFTKDGMKYNYLNIYKEKEISLEFINNSENNGFVVEFNTDRSRYQSLVFHFVQLLYELNEITETYRQITIDEYLEEKKLIKIIK